MRHIRLMRPRWERIDMDDKLTVVDALIDNIRVGRGDVQITWKI